MSQELINGPINAARLEGMNKTVHLFMDWHNPLNSQTKCDNIKSTDIDKYLIKIFDSATEKDKIYDFFFEIRPTKIKENVINNKDIYIGEVVEMFKKVFVIDKNKVSMSKEFPKVRLHYIDIRDYANNAYGGMFQLNDYIYRVIRSGYINTQDIDHIKGLLGNDLYYVDYISNLLYPNKPIKLDKPKSTIPSTRYTVKEMDDIIDNLIDKIKNKYKNENNKKIINQIINNELKNTIDEYYGYVKEFSDLLDKLKGKLSTSMTDLDISEKYIGYGIAGAQIEYMFYELSLCNQRVESAELQIFSLLTDLFFVRRFVDKEYITNGIAYTGIAHSTNYIYILCKYFGFDITHYVYLKESPKKVIDIIKKLNDPVDLAKYIYPPVLKQCSDITLFPKIIE